MLWEKVSVAEFLDENFLVKNVYDTEFCGQ